MSSLCFWNWEMKMDLVGISVSKESQQNTVTQDSDKSNLLCVLLDLSPNLFDRLDKFVPSQSAKSVDLIEADALETFLLQLITFLHVFLLSNFANRLVIIVYNEYNIHVVYEDKGLNTLSDPSNSASFLLTEERQERLTRLDSEFLKNVASFIESYPYNSCEENGTLLSASLSFALCYLHRRILSERYEARILCLHASSDVPKQYIGVMNSIFCAQRWSILIDVCNLHEEESSLLQQAAHLTGGIYFKPKQSEAIPLSNYLCSLYFPSRDARKYLKIPVLNSVDCSALCFESGEKIHMGYICSVCLATFGRKRLSCNICGAEFAENDKS
ncbi:General transcription factor IIH subunit 3 [Galdieria sulphuraria]|uniref:Transcription initiation factor TFIIH subunit H3 isoform 1 n=1 Tax=Galdieria sulphuraria TaxID=130081 RepID=M2WTX6_GALSU|nr:transcription initiation factor TFIIH subunit H3 isoform 2 [Galdieria sulphuraria]XP_005703871.1 transcription initiation factor TFIIH subunit H3 isoform 1 [Galdieria sulphuraria]EME27350.1 transcription initiation factor TFIIH subunit H3 isoform 2 [Galdieria sulphuraria]EME27351.1 transcription initiation factor TFIIH subunit H3 isoform 1 [Galdieria sulphuraria]GJD09505.1 General transcription factor IIH subunit 3 [Galdieria sulphuraria]|eukprot:XP_005703870.1 transcription initiation factor TFIIH subunit H3 isoform 2 [Galdieria sulphuraria]